MDNLTHSLVGALLGQCGLKRLSGRSMATLVIAANLPDVDAFAAFTETGLAFRRGITHGPIALLLLPLALTGLMLAWDRWRPSAVPVRAGPLLLLAYIGTLSHPALDYLNSYGIRLLEPFSSQWVYGDTLFIIDPWIWAALIIGFLWSRWRDRRGGDGRRLAWIGASAIGAYIFANGIITGSAEAQAGAALPQRSLQPVMVVASPVPAAFWRRTILWRDERLFGSGDYRLGHGVRLSGGVTPIRLDHSALAASRGRPDVEAFLFWSRMPIVVERGGQAFLTDQRFSDRLPAAGEDGVAFRYDPFTIPLDSAPPAP